MTDDRMHQCDKRKVQLLRMLKENGHILMSDAAENLNCKSVTIEHDVYFLSKLFPDNITVKRGVNGGVYWSDNEYLQNPKFQ